jgi:hypothetical protein
MDAAIEDILKWGSHAPPKTVMRLYTSVDWGRICDEVGKLKLTPREKLESAPEELVKFRRVLPKRAMVPRTSGDQGQKQRSPRNSGASKWRRRESNSGLWALDGLSDVPFRDIVGSRDGPREPIESPFRPQLVVRDRKPRLTTGTER